MSPRRPRSPRSIPTLVCSLTKGPAATNTSPSPPVATSLTDSSRRLYRRPTRVIFRHGTPVPQAPRLIVDFLGTLDRLPFRLHVRAEFEEVGRKPLGDGFISVPVREFRGALVRSFMGGRLD